MSFVRHKSRRVRDSQNFVSGFPFLKKSRNGLSGGGGLSIASIRGEFAGDGLVAAASSMAAVRPSPSVIRDASPPALYPPKVSDWA